MAAEISQDLKKRAADDCDEDDWIGPLPSEAAQPKKRKHLEFEQMYLDNLPTADSYEKSYMHRDVITDIAITKTDFIITASCDGHIKFWKKMEEGIEFVKHFRSHLGTIEGLAVNNGGTLLCTVSNDESMKIFDVVNFDMINMIRIGFAPTCCEWVHKEGDAISAVAVAQSGTGVIRIYDGRGSNEPLQVLEKMHSKPVHVIKYNTVFEIAISVDKSGMLEYWSSPKKDCVFPKKIGFASKLDTDLYEFCKQKTYAVSVAISPDGKRFATMGADRKVRVFNFFNGKLVRVFDESLQQFSEMQQAKQLLPNMEFGRRMAGERDLEKSDSFDSSNIVFDESGHFILYSTMLGVKVVNLHTNRCVRVIGKPENIRLLQVALFQGKPQKSKAAVTIEMQASDNPTLECLQSDPSVFCTAFKKNRFYIFSRREPEDTKSVDAERDVFNEKPSKEDIVAATEAAGQQRLYSNGIIHTTLGDIHCTLFAKECPKTVENFCVHSKNGYYNGHVFHRVIKGFMIQTGDPLGTGTGGESVWGGEFEDEFHASLRHDRPYTLSMANAGPNTNGSQFFITVIPTPWLDNKHTVFGRVLKGMEVVQNISNMKTHPKTDKPYEDIRIISITMNIGRGTGKSPKLLLKEI